MYNNNIYFLHETYYKILFRNFQLLFPSGNRGKCVPCFPLSISPRVMSYTCTSQAAACDNLAFVRYGFGTFDVTSLDSQRNSFFRC